MSGMLYLGPKFAPLAQVKTKIIPLLFFSSPNGMAANCSQTLHTMHNLVWLGLETTSIGGTPSHELVSIEVEVLH